MIICSEDGRRTILEEILKTVSAYVYTEHIGATFPNQYESLIDSLLQVFLRQHYFHFSIYSLAFKNYACSST